MEDQYNIAVIGDGGWGTTLAVLLSKKGHKTSLWGFFPEYVGQLRAARENVKFLPGIRIPDSVKITHSLEDALRDARITVLAVPSQFVRGVLDMLKNSGVRSTAIISAVKGIENSSLKRMSQVIEECIRPEKLAVLSGPTIALEAANGVPTTAVAASADADFASEAQQIFMTDRFRIYTSPDVAGVELGGSLKNIIAIAAGASDGLGFGTNTKAAILTRGLVEIVRLGVAMGARAETFYGLSGLGDLATTCMSSYSRNRWLGEEIAKGKKLRDLIGSTDMVIEGVVTAKSAYELAKQYSIEMPITTEIYKVLYENKDAKIAVNDLMTRSKKGEC